MDTATARGRARTVVREGGIRLETYVDGVGPTFVVIPSYGRGSGTDFDDLTARLVTAGWTVLRPQPRGGAGSGRPRAGRARGTAFHDLPARLVTAGWTVLRPQPRGVAGSVGPMTGLTLHDLADDGAPSLSAPGEPPAAALGHRSGSQPAP